MPRRAWAKPNAEGEGEPSGAPALQQRSPTISAIVNCEVTQMFLLGKYGSILRINILQYSS